MREREERALGEEERARVLRDMLVQNTTERNGRGNREANAQDDRRRK